MNHRIPPAIRRLVLGGALLLATLLALAPDLPSARAAEVVAHPPPQLAQDDAKTAAETSREVAREVRETAREAAKEAASAAKDASKPSRRGNIEVNVDTDSPTEQSGGKHRKGITIDIGGVDRQYDSFEQFVDTDPALAGGVLGIVSIVFLTPVLVIALVIWYKLRRNRMQNEAMLKLVEKGLVPPGEAMQAIGTGRVGAALGMAEASMPLAERARALRSQAAWSDLRKGVLLGAVGLGFTVFYLFDSGSLSLLGLVLLCVGIGFCVIWYFEDRQLTMSPAARPDAPATTTNPGARQN